MEPRWKRRLTAARAQVLADGPELLKVLTSNNATLEKALDDVLAGVGWRQVDFLNHYYEMLMRENRRG